MAEPPLVIVQARTGSQRLPGKALLDFRGMPLAILVARRAANRGARVTLATSDQPSDDALSALARHHGVNLVRGPLDNVLARFVLAISSEPDNAPVVRLTADNLLPDGGLIAEVVAQFEARGLDYITSGQAASGLPYGCAVEVMRAGHLRRAAQQARTAYEQEHVTPFIRQTFGTNAFTEHADLGCANLRATIDCLDDFDALYHATPSGVDLTQLPWRRWVMALRRAGTSPRSRRAVGDMVLGTAQLGMAYGIASRNTPDDAESLAMMRRAITEGVDWIDTARGYGRSEALIGRLRRSGWDGRMRIVTKLSALADVPREADPKFVRALAENSLLRSCLALDTDNLDCVLLHRAGHLHQWNGAAFDSLRQWQDAGQIGTIGISVQSPEELEMALSRNEIGHVQLPCNILDHRWDMIADSLRAARSRRKLVVHVRSALLQGLLSTVDPALWARAHVDDPHPVSDWLSRQAAILGRTGVVDLCLAWARGLDWADGVVVGCDSLAQLKNTVELFNQPALKRQEIDALSLTRPFLDTRSLDPARWAAKQRPAT
ncbi:MAG: hypothetical protein TEF_03785 [Rhizobiales bacterium NRL2]|nr:MAG: hypothetical protein TEF_03785 [Rhizobiales bacterium NRL2]